MVELSEKTIQEMLRDTRSGRRFQALLFTFFSLIVSVSIALSWHALGEVEDVSPERRAEVCRAMVILVDNGGMAVSGETDPVAVERFLRELGCL